MEKMISKKRTLLISTLYDSGQVAEPVACGYLAAYLIKHKHPTDILCTFPDDKNIKIIISKISDYKPSLIAFTAWDINVEFVLLVSKIIKQRYKNITIIVGGYQAPKLSLLHNDSIDHLVIGEGENAILSIISSLENNRVIKDRIIKSQPIKNLDNLPFPARQLIDYDLFPLIDELRTSNNISLAYSYIFTYRGCPMSCTFCAIHQVHEKNIRKRSIP